MRDGIAHPIPTSRPARQKWPLRRLGAILAPGLLLLLVLVFAFPMWRMSDVPEGLDYSTTQRSEQGRFVSSYALDSATIPINQLHSWTLHVESAEGKPIEHTQILVDGDMPQHGHGLPTQPVVTQYLGNGDYLVEGMKFQMGGWWVMEFTIHAAGQSDVVRFNLLLE